MTFNEAFPTYETNVKKQLIKAIVSRQMFCKKTQKVLDCRKDILVDIMQDGKTQQIFALHHSQIDALTNFQAMFLKAYPNFTIEFTTCNKKLKHKLLTILK